MLIVGIDCATSPKKTGLARSTINGSKLLVHEAWVAQSRDDIVTTVASWMLASDVGVLALDAPLGWPQAMGRVLGSHQAGLPIDVEGNRFFQRKTDRIVQRELGKKPLEVGANLIARTALEALGQLSDIRAHVPLQMGWSPGAVEKREVIEVYPAATLISRSISASKYKDNGATDRRAEILNTLDVTLEGKTGAQAEAVDHVLDAVIACVAAADYVRGEVVYPGNLKIAKTEGWIWFKPGGGQPCLL